MKKSSELSGARRTRGAERGVVLVLVMLVVLVLACVMVGLFFTTTVNREITVQLGTRFPMTLAARGAFLQAQAVLLQDIESQGASDTGGDGGLGGGDGGTGGDGTGEDETGGAANTDSLVDEWARPGAITVMTSNDLNVMVLVRDEDAKFNVLSIMAEDEELAEECREILVRLIDNFRENSREDISSGTARTIVESLVDWLEGRRDEDDFPKPKIKRPPEPEDPDSEEQLREPIECPLTIEELQMCKGLTPEILFGFKHGDERTPGLVEFITCYSNLVFEGLPEDEEDKTDPGSLGPTDQGEDEGDGEGEGTDQGEEESEALETNDGRINVNTAPRAVLRALMDDSEIPTSVIDKILDFRHEAIKAYEEMMEREDKFGSKLDSGEKEEEDFIFDNPAEVVKRVEDYFETSFNLGADEEEKFASRLAVTANVFTIYISVQEAEGAARQNFRAVVWRRTPAAESAEEETEEQPATSEAQVVTLVPLEEYPYPLPLSEEEEKEFLTTF